MTISVEALEAAKLAVVNSQLGVDRYDGSPSDYDTDIRAALEAALPLLTDPIETGREAALGQWEERWRQLRGSLRSDAGEGRDSEELARVHYAMDVIEQTIPTGKPTGSSRE